MPQHVMLGGEFHSEFFQDMENEMISYWRDRPTMTVAASLIVASVAGMAVAEGTEDKTIGLLDRQEGCSPGYNLFTPLNSIWTYLIDLDGNLVREWTDTWNGGNSVYLLDNGDLLRCADNGPQEGSVLAAGGDGGCIHRFNWEGDLEWEYCLNNPEYRLHHDIQPMPNGNVLAIAWEYKSYEEAVQAGRDPESMDVSNSLWPLYIVEVEPTGSEGGNIVWEWRLWDHVIQDQDPSAANFGVISENPGKVDLNRYRDEKGDWIHANSIDYNAELDQILISTPFLSELWVINHGITSEEAAGPAGDLIYRWGNPQNYGQGTIDDQRNFFSHDARWVDSDLPGAGNITFFNNGQGRPEGSFSTIYEFTPDMNMDGTYDLVDGRYGPLEGWELYRADPAEDFYSSGLSGVERQPNGNTIFCKGRGGVFYEIDTPEKGEEFGDIIWLYVNPVASTGPLHQSCPPSGQNSFRYSRYAEDFVGFIGKDLTPMGPLELPACLGDFDCTGVVDGADLTLLLGAWGTIDSEYDLTGEGVVDGADLTLLLGFWGICSG